MSKGYMKDPNGKYRLVDKDKQVEPIFMENQGPKTQPLSLEEIDARLRKVESFLFLAGTNKQ